VNVALVEPRRAPGPPEQSPPERPSRQPSGRAAEAARPRIALVGNPNTGKTTLFNHLCGLRAKTANYPGTTTDIRMGRAKIGGVEAEIVDLPGLYRIDLDLPESRLVRSILEGAGVFRRPDAVVVVVDAANLTRNLCLVGELLTCGVPVVVALNMVDLARRRGISVDQERLAAELGCPVVPLVARKRTGVAELLTQLEDELSGTAEGVATEGGKAPHPETDAAAGPPPTGAYAELVAWAERVAAASLGGEHAIGAEGDTVTERLDQAFTHPLLGVLVFGGVMFGLFWAIFALATVPMDLIEVTFEHLGGWIGSTVPPGAIRDLLVEGVVGGIAGTVVFLPQICLLFFLISLLEDTGYLARAAFVMDRVLCRFGLPGHAFVPLLSSHACAIPGILSAKLIPDRADRLATILVAPFMSCSARLPVYVLLTSLLFAGRPVLAGLAFAGCYVLGAAAALGTAFVARRTVLRGRSRPMVLELPSYKLPSLRSALIVAWDQGFTFLRKAGTVILSICIVMWWLSNYPQAGPAPQAEALRAQAAVAAPVEAAALTDEANALDARYAQAQSFAGRLGRLVEPAFAPLGYDWQLTVGVMTSFLAREVFVSTMAVLLVGDTEADVEEGGIIDRIRGATRDDGRPVFTPATAASLLVFFVLAMQCLPTLAVTRREAGGWRWAALQLGYMTGLAWVVAFVVYHGLHAIGVT
jgi:ferrous iron transport protein B